MTKEFDIFVEKKQKKLQILSNATLIYYES